MKLSIICTLLLPLSPFVDASTSTKNITMRVKYVEEGQSLDLRGASVQCSWDSRDSFEDADDKQIVVVTQTTDSNGYVELAYNGNSTRDGRIDNPSISCIVTHDKRPVYAVYTDTIRTDRGKDKTAIDFGTVLVYPDRVERGDPGTMNGCGPESLPSWFSSSMDSISGIQDACNVHDLCYENCSENQLSCDEEFLAIGHSICNTRSVALGKSVCKVGVSVFYRLLRLFGTPFYDDARVKVGCDDASTSSTKKKKKKNELLPLLEPPAITGMMMMKPQILGGAKSSV